MKISDKGSIQNVSGHTTGKAKVKLHSKKASTPEINTEDKFQASEKVADDLKHDIKKLLLNSTALPKSSFDLKGYMLPDNEGRVKHMCMTVGTLGGIDNSYFEVIKTMVSKMPQARFTILVNGMYNNDIMKIFLNKWTKQGLVENPERVKLVNTDASVSMWAQDSLLVSGNKVIEQERKWFPGWGDGKVASEIAKVNPDLKLKKLKGVFIDGGNQRATRDKIFVGSDAIAFALDNMREYPRKYYKIASDSKIPNAKKMEKEELMKAIMEKSFPHQEIVIVGHKGEQPAFHIDMAVTPLGKKDPESGKPVMIVGDPKMALNILTDMKKKNPKKYKKYQDEMQRKTPSCSTKPLDMLVKQMKTEVNVQENFEALAKGFDQMGYKVERVPYLGSSSLDYTPWITYNNSVIDGDNVFIPNFGIPELDNPGNGAYEKYGYNPIPIDMTAVSSMQGAINCVTKVLEREYQS